MNKETIIRWAIETGIGDGTIEFYKEELAHFAALAYAAGAKDENEACFQIADENTDIPGGGDSGDLIATAIRARTTHE